MGGLTGEPNRVLIEALRNMLEQAESGEIVGAAIAMTNGRDPSRAPYLMVGEIDGFYMSGALGALKFHVDARNASGADIGEGD